MTRPRISSPERARTGVLVVLVAQLMLVLDATVVNVALPRIDADLGFGPASLSWVLNAYTLAFGGLLLLSGRLRDVRGGACCCRSPGRSTPRREELRWQRLPAPAGGIGRKCRGGAHVGPLGSSA